MTYDSTADTLDHTDKVQTRMSEVIRELLARAAVHDASKLEEPEKSGYDALHTRLEGVEYGTDEYRAALAEAAPVIAHHYAHNSHHPEHYGELGVAGMSLLDLIEMFCDWKAAGERTKQGSMTQSLEVNRTRFNIDDQLAAIFENTRHELGWE